MTAPAVTNTFANSTTSDAPSVNTNFTDIINALTDGTKSLSIDALTCAGAVSLNGNVTLGNASSDDITITGSIASHVNIKTDATYDIGTSSIGLRALYFGANSKRVNFAASGSTSATWTFTLPVTAGTVDYVLETNGSGVSAWVPQRKSSWDMQNLSISTSVNASALTVTLAGVGGTAFSSSNPGYIMFDSVTSNVHDGDIDEVKITSNITFTMSSGSTLGFASGATHYMYVYAINNGGTAELAVCGVELDEGTVQSSTAEGGAGGADSIYTLYSTTARTNVSIKKLARITFSLTTAGTWDEAGDNITWVPFKIDAISFAAFMTSSSQTITAGSGQEVVFSGETTDTHNLYSVSTGRFIAPRSGIFSFMANLTIGAGATAPSDITCYFLVNGSGKLIGSNTTDNLTNSKYATRTIIADIKLTAGQYVSCWVNPTGQNVTVNHSGGNNDVSSFFGHFVG